MLFGISFTLRGEGGREGIRKRGKRRKERNTEGIPLLVYYPYPRQKRGEAEEKKKLRGRCPILSYSLLLPRVCRPPAGRKKSMIKKKKFRHKIVSGRLTRLREKNQKKKKKKATRSDDVPTRWCRRVRAKKETSKEGGGGPCSSCPFLAR